MMRRKMMVAFIQLRPDVLLLLMKVYEAGLSGWTQGSEAK